MLTGDEAAQAVGNAFDVDSEVIERNLGLLPSEDGTFVEGYRKEKRLFHLHCRLVVSRDRHVDFHEYCATFNYAGGPDGVAMDAGTGGDARDIKGDFVGRPCCEVDAPMLVDIRHLSKNPEGVVAEVILPSVVWLQSLDDCLRVWPDSPNLIARRSVASPRAVESIRIVHDGEFCRPIVTETVRVPTVGDGVDEVIEARSEVIDEVSDKGGPSQEGRSLLEDNPSPEDAPNW